MKIIMKTIIMKAYGKNISSCTPIISVTCIHVKGNSQKAAYISEIVTF